MTASTARRLVDAKLPRCRPATRDDIAALVALEARCFDSDRLSRRSFLWMIRRGNGWLEVAEDEQGLLGYVLVLFHRGTSLARLYSIAVDSRARGLGLGRHLLQLGEAEALRRGAVYMRLEVRPDNARAIAVYEGLGYRQSDVFDDYYEDHSDALRFEKRIRKFDGEVRNPVTLYVQTTDFTCGPAALMMALRALDPSIAYSRSLEFQLWREATTIYMTAGHGGCSPRGLALAAWRRGFRATIYLSESGPLFTDGVRNPEKKEVLELVHHDFVEQVAAAGIEMVERGLTTQEMVGYLEQGAMPLVLVSSYQFTRNKSPHWVLLTAADDDFIYLHDPDVDEDEDKIALDNAYVPVPRARFERYAQFGRRALRAAVVVHRPDGGG
ncbi:MAG TPA: GNAT family N-acetyltransferase/peptidase C39 family protein [Gammaproteobacteria bacterium]